ncbi:MAG: hypothetical protein [Malazfec virus 1]
MELYKRNYVFIVPFPIATKSYIYVIAIILDVLLRLFITSRTTKE